jgi:hypothetical protein
VPLSRDCTISPRVPLSRLGILLFVVIFVML